MISGARSTTTRLGILGGTFDPIHEAHLQLARACAEDLSLDEVRFVTNRLPPHKAGAEASACDRHAMVALATSGEEDFVADPREVMRDAPSFTIETVEALRAERPSASLFLLVGGDSLVDLCSWRRWRDVVTLATLVAVPRAGIAGLSRAREEVAGASGADVIVLERAVPDVSSRTIRTALGRGAAPEGLLPALVADYVRKRGLYGVAEQVRKRGLHGAGKASSEGMR